ncbi:helix-turn-helix transcriptional regulator [Ectobacillus ponti]|uniref:AraC family transcriptional regulator n=1 Tax=Ectobacillus ponti TaxID=2961894 RepID=A0AA41X5S1_9BACI|nr:AraC family transcriptional regulator [Ectobacillus ponti]MCP8969456.1 AraC family transcriptional regulator [Ectobacillus ponti]
MQSSIQQSVIKQYLRSREQHQQENYLHPPFEYERQLLEAIRLGKEAHAKEVLERINALKGARLAQDPVRSRKNSLIAACTLFTRAVIEGGVHPETAFQLSDAYILEIEKLSSLPALQQMEYDMLHHFTETVRGKQEVHGYSLPVRSAAAYVHENILQRLSLDEAAQQAHVHPGYLSSRFKQETGLSFTDFVNQKRIEESKYFLLHTSYSISDIALLFQFCNQSYFTALFKKYTGLTPREFRQREQP